MTENSLVLLSDFDKPIDLKQNNRKQLKEVKVIFTERNSQAANLYLFGEKAASRVVNAVNYYRGFKKIDTHGSDIESRVNDFKSYIIKRLRKDCVENPRMATLLGFNKVTVLDTRNLYSDCNACLRSKEQSYESVSENMFADSIASVLNSKGWSTVREMRAYDGYIDILAQKAETQVIIEVKLKSDMQSIARAMGQCLFYKQIYPKAKLVVVALERMPMRIAEVLSANGFDIFFKTLFYREAVEKLYGQLPIRLIGTYQGGARP